MSFPEAIRIEAKKRSAFRCCIDQRPFVEVHHIIPSSEGGPDTIDNAAPLCAACHDLFGGNPEKRKQIRQMRDHWWERVAALPKDIAASIETLDIELFQENPNGIRNLRSPVVLYHCVFPEEDFDTSAKTIFELIRWAQEQFPGHPRHLYLDIDGHRNNKGGYDHDMHELQRHFILGFMLKYLCKAFLPLVAVENNKLQRNDIAEALLVQSSDKPILNHAPEGYKIAGIHVADNDTYFEDK